MFRPLLFAALLVCLGASARAQHYGPPTPPPPTPLALVIQGGASLGAFEAGVLHYLTATLRQNPSIATTRVLAGTSAGSINGLLSALALCGHGADRPADSVFWQTWIPVGLDGLFDPARVTAQAALTREGVMREVAADLAARIGRGLDADCDLLFGVPVTRLDPRTVRLDAEGKAPLGRIEERFAVRVQGRGMGRAPSIQNYVDPSAIDDQILLATDTRGEIPFVNLMALLHASSGIPGAFEPVAIPHCFARRGQVRTQRGGNGRRVGTFGPLICDAADAKRSEVVDGGFLNNQPVRLATQLLVQGLGQGDALRPRPDSTRRALPESGVLLALDPTSMTWAPAPRQDPSEEESLAAMLGRVLPGLLEAARTAELQALVDEHPAIRERLGILQSDWPTASELLGAFMGFLEEDFRVFDFHLGMHEARRMAETHLGPLAAERGRPLQSPAPHAGRPRDIREAWRPVRCIELVVGGGDPTEARVACGGQEQQNHRALLQTSIDRLYARCRGLDADVAALLPLGPQTDARRHCVQAYAGQAPPAVPGLTPLPVDTSAEDDPLALFLGRLEAYGFIYRDLASGAAPAAEARAAIARRVTGIARALGAAQPSDGLAYRTAARVLGHRIAYSPPDHALHAIAGGTWELGWSVTDPRSALRALRFGLALQVDGLPSLLDGEGTTWFGLTPLLGIEFEPLALSGALFQMRMGARAGFRFASGDSFTADAAPTETLFRSRPIVDLHLAGVFAQWLRVQLSAAWLPGYRGLDNALSLRAMIGVELDLPL